MQGDLEGASPFAGMANVRVSTARPWVIGATTTSGNLKVNITHTGPETIVDTSNTAFFFTHRSIVGLFEFVIGTKTILLDASGFGVIESGTDDADFAPPGPFAVWTVTIDPDLNPGLDMSGVTEVDIEFCGAVYPFPSR